MGTARVVYRSATSVWQKRWGGDLSDGEEGEGGGKGDVGNCDNEWSVNQLYGDC